MVFMNKFERLEAENSELKHAVVQANNVIITLMDLAGAASEVMKHVVVAMHGSHPEIAASARTFVASWAEFVAGVEAARATSEQQNTLSNYTKN
jgi:hypothetical protein